MAAGKRKDGAEVGAGGRNPGLHGLPARRLVPPRGRLVGRPIADDTDARYGACLRAGARAAVAAARRSGLMGPARLVKCEWCPARAARWHHEDYRRPLDVVAICVGCHRRRHAGLAHGLAHAVGVAWTRSFQARLDEGERLLRADRAAVLLTSGAGAT